MNKKPVIGGIILVAIVIAIVFGAQINPDNPENAETNNSEVWSMRIAGPEFDDISTHSANIGVLEKGNYEISFVPMGDSPEQLNINISSKFGKIFSEQFILDRDLVDTGISKYYTWEYLGEKYIIIPETGKYEIEINREGNLKGSVSISITKIIASI